MGTETMMIPTIAAGLPIKSFNAAKVTDNSVNMPKNSASENFIPVTSDPND